MSGTLSRKGGATAGQSTAPTQNIRQADNYGVEVVGFDGIESSVFVSEMVLLMEHLKAEMAADNYFGNGEEER